jgi:hypothetical protein
MVRLAYLLVMGCTLWILLSETFCSLLSVATISRAFTVVPLVAIILVPCGYLAVRVVVIVIAGSPPLASIFVSSIILWRSRPFVVARFFSICKSVCYIY